MKSYRLTQAAEDDFFEIWTFIAADNVPEADRLEVDLLNACQRVADRPDIGYFRRALTDKPVRFLLVRSTYLIVYDPATEPLQVIRVLHGVLDAAAQLQHKPG